MANSFSFLTSDDSSFIAGREKIGFVLVISSKTRPQQRFTIMYVRKNGFKHDLS